MPPKFRPGAPGTPKITGFFKRACPTSNDQSAESSDEKRHKITASPGSVPSTPSATSTVSATSTTGLTAQPHNSAIQPFKKRDSYPCPFRIAGRLCTSPSSFNSSQSQANHVWSAHKHDVPTTTLPESPYEDGNIKIPCPKGCKRMFCTYNAAMQHAKLTKKKCNQGEDSGPLHCHWKDAIGCDRTFTTAKGKANHYRSHVEDVRGPYQCSKGCDQFHADLYMLAAHEDRCDGSGAVLRETSLRFPLTALAQTSFPSILVIGRFSGSYLPSSWFAGKETLQEGLPIWGDAILRHFIAYAGLKGPQSAVVHACYEVRSLDLPAPAINNSFQEKHERRRWELHRAWAFTKALMKDIKAANDADVTPVLLSAGLDAWTCNVPMIGPWLQAHPDVRFKLVLRMNKLEYGMTQKYATLHQGVFWCTYTSEALRQAFKVDPVDNEESIATLFKAWEILQGKKNTLSENSLMHGRNKVDFSARFPRAE